MARVSNGILTIINLLTLVVSFCAIGLALWYYLKIGSPCERDLRMPLLVIGGALLLVSMAGLMGACCRVSFFMWLYLITLFVMIVGLIAFTAFAIVVTNKGIGKALSENGVGNGKLGDYSWWLQNYVINSDNWDRIKRCMIHVRLCDSIVGGLDIEFYKLNMPPIQSVAASPKLLRAGVQECNNMDDAGKRSGSARPGLQDMEQRSDQAVLQLRVVQDRVS
ncbi:hypothetical protein DH2020_038140 [Rehmannia glutinosa]|uniref:Uncharacterized protein n=1 Tax=Rehmannia glutinosa TaxID=99300 RepID=A0ABR0UZG0_REHGL